MVPINLAEVMVGIDFEAIMKELSESGRYTHQLWYNDESMAFIARGREYRSEFHSNASYEIQYSLKGDLNLHYRMPDGEERVAFVPEGSCIYQPAMVPHSPRFSEDSFQFVIERARKPGEIDKFHWYCQNCDNLLHEESYVVDDYKSDPVGQAYANYSGSEEFRTCKKCGTVAPPLFPAED